MCPTLSMWTKMGWKLQIESQPHLFEYHEHQCMTEWKKIEHYCSDSDHFLNLTWTWSFLNKFQHDGINEKICFLWVIADWVFKGIIDVFPKL